MDNRTVFEAKLGGLYKAGNGSRIPDGKTTEAKNLIIRAGRRLVKRDGALGEATTHQPAYFFKFQDLIFHSSFTIAGIPRPACCRFGGAWGVTAVKSAIDMVEYKDRLYGLLNPSTALAYPGIFGATDAATLITNAGGGELMTGSSICAEIGRLFVSDPKFAINNLAYFQVGYKFEDPALWTPTNVTIAVVGNKRKMTTNVVAAATKIVSAAAIGTTGATAEILTPALHVQPVPGLGREVPLTLRLVDSAGSVFTEREFLVPRYEVDPSWTLNAAEYAEVPALNNYYIHIVPGTSFTPAQVNDAVYISEFLAAGNDNKGLLVKNGAYIPAKFPLSDVLGIPSPLYVESWPGRIAYCDVDDTRIWKSEFYSDTRKAAIRLLRTANGFVYAFSDDSITTFQLTDNADLPIAATGVVIEGVGCYGKQSWTYYGGKQYFADPRGVYVWDGHNVPEQIIDEGVLDEITGKDASPASSFALAIDEQNKELIYCSRNGKIYVLNLTLGEWTWLQVTASDGSIVTPGDVFWGRFASGDGELWFSFFDNSTAAWGLFQLKKGQRRDVTNAVAQSIKAEYDLHTFETAPQAKMITLESLELQHEVTYDQTNSTTRVYVSRDGGTNFVATSAARHLNLANGDSVPAKFPIRSTARKQIVRIVHSGDGGEDAFNFNAVAIWTKLRGNVKQPVGTSA